MKRKAITTQHNCIMGSYYGVSSPLLNEVNFNEEENTGAYYLN
jgi:hypothetical protein